MTAKEMFEKLGFQLEEITDDYIAYGYRGNKEDRFVCFELKNKYFQCFYNSENTKYSQPLEVNYELYKAINENHQQ